MTINNDFDNLIRLIKYYKLQIQLLGKVNIVYYIIFNYF